MLAIRRIIDDPSVAALLGDREIEQIGLPAPDSLHY